MPRPETRAERVARNEATFRTANDELRERFEQEDDQGETFPFLCECANERCTQVVTLTLEEYELVRSHLARFVTLPGHEEPETEVVLDEEQRFQVVQKTGEAAEVARRLAGGGTGADGKQ